MKKMNKKGFTIVELVIVIAVIAILAGVMIPTFGNVIENAQESKALQEAKNAYTAYINNELLNVKNPADYKAYNQDIIVEASNGKLVSITADGEATLVASGTADFKVENNTLVEVSSTPVVEKCTCGATSADGNTDGKCDTCGKDMP